MAAKRIILALFLIGLVSVSACISAKPTSTLQECEQKPSINERDVCYMQNAFSNNELSYCTQIIDANVRNTCINDLP